MVTDAEIFYEKNDIIDEVVDTINDFVYISTRNGPAQARVMMKSVLSSAEHGRCPHKY